MLVLLISFTFTVSPKKSGGIAPKKPRAAVAKNIIGQLKEEENDNKVAYVKIVTCDNGINIPVTENLSSLVSHQKRPELP